MKEQSPILIVLFLFLRKGREDMKKIRSYTSIWSVEKVIYAINDLQLPFPITFTQMTWFIVSLFVVILFGSLPPLSLIDGALLKYLGIPIVLTGFMCQKTFDGKKPYGFLKSIITYALRPKVTYPSNRECRCEIFRSRNKGNPNLAI